MHRSSPVALASGAGPGDRLLRMQGLVALGALVAELVSMPWLVHLDAAVWLRVLYARTCAWDRLAERMVEWSTWGAGALLAATAVQSIRRVGVRATWPPLAVCAVGLQAGKALKNFFARERPSMLPDVALGHSFPSGHVMNTALVALAVIILSSALRHRLSVRLASGTLLAAIAAGRLLVGHHWLLDAVGGALAAAALMGLALPLFRKSPLLAPAALAGALAIVVTVDVHVRSLEIRLPSPLSIAADTVEVDVPTLLGTPLAAGGWRELPEPLHRFTPVVLRGDGVLTVTLPERAGPAPAERGDRGLLVMAGRPITVGRRCLTARVAVNDRPLPPFVLFVGWREYRLPLPPGTLRPGRNDIRITVEGAGDEPNDLGLAYLRLRPG